MRTHSFTDLSTLQLSITAKPATVLRCQTGRSWSLISTWSEMRCHPLTCRPIQSMWTPVSTSVSMTAATRICSCRGNFSRPLIHNSQIVLLIIAITIPFSTAMKTHFSVTSNPTFRSTFSHQITYLTSLGQNVLGHRQKAFGSEYNIVTPISSFWLRS